MSIFYYSGYHETIAIFISMEDINTISPLETLKKRPDIEVMLSTSKKKIIATYFLTKSVQETATQLNYSYHWVYQILRQFGILTPKRKKTGNAFKSLTKQAKQQIAEAYLEGMPVNHIRCKYNISTVVLYLVVSDFNLVKRYAKKTLQWNNLPEEIKAGLMAEVLILNSYSVPITQISRELKLPLSKVRSIIESKND